MDYVSNIIMDIPIQWKVWNRPHSLLMTSWRFCSQINQDQNDHEYIKKKSKQTPMHLLHGKNNTAYNRLYYRLYNLE